MIVVYTTFEDGDAARQVGKILVEENLAACAQVMSPLVAVYRWKGEVCENGEVAMLMKTDGERLPELLARLEEIHPYEVPAIEWWEADATARTEGWLRESLR